MRGLKHENNKYKAKKSYRISPEHIMKKEL